MRAAICLTISCVAIAFASDTLVAETGTGPRSKRTVAPALPSAASALDKARGAPGRGRQRLAERRPLGKTLVQPSGEDAAYIAFDQGQYLTAKRIAEKRAKADDPQAHTLLGRLYAEGLGVVRDEVAAARWYRRGAELGDTEAMFAFGVILVAGKAIKRDYAGAAQMFEQAARKGHALAHYNLGLLFLAGKGKPENPRRAAMHLEYAARKGIAAAQYDLAALYQNGHGVAADAYKAATWLKRAADKGMPPAQFEYAVAILTGRGFNADKPNIIAYLTSAARAGIAGAQNRLAQIYASGIQGVTRDPVAAAKWHLIARANGIADKALDALVAKQPRAIRLKAEREAEAFAAKVRVGVSVQ